MPRKFSMTRDVNGFNGFGVFPSLDIWNTTLAANTEQHFTVPASAAKWIAVFSFDPGLRIFCAYNLTAAVPGASFVSGTAELNPTAWEVKAGDVLSFITPDTSAYMTVKFYAL